MDDISDNNLNSLINTINEYIKFNSVEMNYFILALNETRDIPFDLYHSINQ